MHGSPSVIAKYLANFSTADVYEILKDMDYIVKDVVGWKLTDLGRANGGRMSRSNHPTPTFDIDKIIEQMIEFYKKNH